MPDYSPAFAAAISRKLRACGVRQSVEIKRGVESPGFVVMLQTDCVRVEYVPESEPAELHEEDRIIQGLNRCHEVLRQHYAVERCVRATAHPGEWRDGPVLEIRRLEV